MDKVVDEMKPVIDLFANKDPYILYFDGVTDFIMLTAISLKTGNEISHFPINFELLSETQEVFCEELKGVILSLCFVEFDDFPNQYELIKVIKEIFEKKNIAVFNYSLKRFVWTTCLVAADLTLKIGEQLLIVLSDADTIQIANFSFTKNGYRFVEQGAYAIPENLDMLRQFTLSKFSGKNIILSSLSHLLKISEDVRNTFKSDKTIVVDRQKVFVESALTVYNWFIGRQNLRYSILPTCESKYEFGFKFHGKHYPLVTVERHTHLPFNYTVELPRSAFVFYIAYEDFFTKKMEYTNLISIKNAAHQRQLSFTLNEQNLPEYSAKPIILDSIKFLPDSLKANSQKEIPIVAFFDNSSVICVWNDEKNVYEFLDSWNGIYGYELLVGFNTEKACYGAEAAAAMRTKPTFVVSDLLNIISKSKKKPFFPYGFEVTKDDDHPVLLECETYDKIRKAASPGFLLALLLKEHKRLIREKSGIRPSKIGFCLPMLKEESCKKERMILINAIEEALKLVRVNSFFIEV